MLANGTVDDPTMLKVRQAFSPKEIVELTIDFRILHGGHPILAGRQSKTREGRNQLRRLLKIE